MDDGLIECVQISIFFPRKLEETDRRQTGVKEKEEDKRIEKMR